MNPVKGLDVSFSATTADWWLRRAAEGYRAMSQCLWTGGFENNAGIRAVAESNLRFAREAGFACSGYINAAPPNWWSDDVALTESAKNADAEWERFNVRW